MTVLHYPVRVDQRGRLLLPAQVRQRLAVAIGGRLLLQLHEDGTVVLQSPASTAQGGKGLLRSLTAGRSELRCLSDELLAERHLAADHE